MQREYSEEPVVEVLAAASAALRDLIQQEELSTTIMQVHYWGHLVVTAEGFSADFCPQGILD